MKHLRPLAVVAFAALAACNAEPSPAARPACPTEPPTTVSAQATLEDAGSATVSVSGHTEGEFVIELDASSAPIATANFVALARCGFYDGITFHRVLADFVIQAGDPGTRENRGDFEGLGAGGPRYEFEIEPPGDDQRYDPYVVAMANDGQTNGSQFFIDLVDLDAQLRQVGIYSIIGRVTTGTEVIDAIAGVPVNDPRMGLPLDPVIIDSIVIGPGDGDADASAS
jgi:peptidyl-prolyl cis-trans isomerase B (cyclophilin B)